ncbi:hypothetical protein DSO57_1027496 [Entomophthora muscae]|uniref:Uncharacterized protein n=1 Tax=Entomophthora muscae TaxID=34485 RepID=A0ACC2SQR2_9FUNG|nr:hypothetical protein DSO57_1027496 [Entomophthora muscae]
MAKSSLDSSSYIATHPEKGSSKQRLTKTALPDQPGTHALYYKERYKQAKALLRVAAKQNLKAEEELANAKSEILQLQKQQNEFLNQLVKNSSDQEGSEVATTSGPVTTPSVSRKRSFKPYDFLPRAALSGTPSKKTKQMSSVVEPSNSKLKKPRQKRDLEKARRVQSVPLNADGSFTLPTQVSIFTVISLGKIDHERPSFHSYRYIMPIGYKVLRYYRSTINPTAQTCYTSSILDGNSGPKFQVVAEDRPNEPFLSDTPSGAWTQILKQASKVRNLQVANSGSGPEYYGLAHPTIAYMIQSLPNARLCSNYHWQNFDILPLNSTQNRSSAAPPLPELPEDAVADQKDASPTSTNLSTTSKLGQSCDGLGSSDHEKESSPSRTPHSN